MHRLPALFLAVLLSLPGPVQGSASTKDRQAQPPATGHWAFQPLRRPTPPASRDESGDRPIHPIDAFIQARLRSKTLAPNARADRRVLIRRAYYDLTGLPPAPGEVESFESDPSPDAWERLIERLLESPHYGEKWGRHWLDLVRFAESNSYERDGAKPHAWRFRDYVIRSFNQDKPYDEFLREQLAGDEFPNPSSDAHIATGYYRLGIWDDEPADKELAQYDALDDILTTTSQVMLGLTLDCARCHDHKTDPLPQRDYYRMLGFFRNIAPYQNGGPTDELLLPSYAAEVDPETALVVSEVRSMPPETFVLLRGNPNLKGEAVVPGFPVILGEGVPSVVDRAPGGSSSGRRSALAQWITSPSHPLTARVMVNRIWQHHFGKGIVASPNNFGLQGDAPTHPELLDWLASEFIARGWKLKSMHRLIMLSEAYQRSSRNRKEALERDPANDLYWRFDLRRLTAEEIRDTLLSVSGQLNAKMFGPGVFVDIPKEVMAGQSVPGNGWGRSPVEEQGRRSIYIHAKRSLLTPILESFDVAETDRSTPSRFATVQPTQALGLLNSDFAHQQSRFFAARVFKETGSNTARQVQLALALATSHMPEDSQIERGSRLIESMMAEDHLSASAALKTFCLMVLSLNELIYVD